MADISLPTDLDPEENVTFVSLQCRICGESGPVERAHADHGHPDGPWDYNHKKATGHNKFYLFRLTRHTARLF